MEKETVKQIVLEQRELFKKEVELVERVIPKNILKTKKIVVITGIRRCGKSTLLKQITRHHEHYAYFNFEDERLLDFTHEDFNKLLEIFLAIDPRTNTFLFDEIQNIKGWEKFARRLFNEGYKLFITGSNASLLSSEIATSLTGRNIQIELYPFSFREFLTYKKFQVKQTYTTKEKAQIAKYLKEYLKYGGFPEVVLTKDEEELKQIYQDVIIKDLLVRFGIRDIKDFRELSLYLLSNISKNISFNNLKNLLGFSNTSKVKNYVDFLSEAYLFFTVFKYDPSVKKQIVNDRKIYAIDSGLVNTISFRFSENEGRILENVVFLELLRQKHDVYYHEDKRECDFLLRKGIKITHALQVSVTLAHPDTEKREIAGLIEAMEKHNLKEGFIITKSEDKKIKVKGRVIIILPLWKILIVWFTELSSTATGPRFWRKSSQIINVFCHLFQFKYFIRTSSL